MFAKFLSRKFIAVILTGMVIPFLHNHGVPDGVIAWLVGLVGTYVAGQSVVDATTANAATKAAVPPTV